MNRARGRGFTLVEVLVALMVVALGLTALMVAVSSAARTTGYLRDKTLAQWVALNHLSELRLNSNKSGLATPAQSTLSASNSQSSASTEVKLANRTWHYDVRYFDTSIASMRRIIIRVYAGDSKTKGNPLAEASGFMGTTLGAPGSSNIDWTAGETIATAVNGQTGTSGTATPATGTPTPNPNPNPNPTAPRTPIQTPTTDPETEP